MARMTDEEADYWDEYYTKNPPVPGPNGTGYFTRCKNAALSVTIDSVTAEYLTNKASETHTTPAQIISEMVRERITASV